MWTPESLTALLQLLWCVRCLIKTHGALRTSWLHHRAWRMKPQELGRTSNFETERCRVGQETTKKKFLNKTRILETHNRFDRKHVLIKQVKANVTPKLLIIRWLRNESQLCKLKFRFLIWIRYREKFLLTPYWNTLILSYEDCLYVSENLYSLSLIFVWNS